jgi:hypothetical protein
MKDHELAAISAEDKLNQAHAFMKKFIADYDIAARGGIHDFMELNVANMIHQAMADIDSYLSTGHKQVVANEIMAITIQAFQTVLDGVKRNLDNVKTIGFA